MSPGMNFAPYFSTQAERIFRSLSAHRQVAPFQWTPDPPTPSPGRKDPSLRIGSASSATLLRTVTVSLAVSIIRSWRCANRSSSRIDGTLKSSGVERGPPRSSTAILRPVGASSRAAMPPVQPMPTITMSTFGSFRVMAAPYDMSAMLTGLAGKRLPSL